MTRALILCAMVATALNHSPAIRERLAASGLEPDGVCGSALASLIAREIETNTRIARELNLKVK